MADELIATALRDGLGIPREAVTREAVEAALHRLSEWRWPQALVDEVLDLVDALVANEVAAVTVVAPVTSWRDVPDLVTGNDLVRPGMAVSLATEPGVEVAVPEPPPSPEAGLDEPVELLSALGVAVTQRCSKCGETKDLVAGFAKDRSRKSGRRAQCRDCVAAYVHGYNERKRQR
jgi:hypothetical protein